MKVLSVLSTFILMSILNIAMAETPPLFENEILTIPVVNTADQVGKYEQVRFKVAKDGRWDLVSYTEPRQGTVETISINMLESFPVQIQVVAAGYFPSGCYSLGKTHIVRENNQFTIVINSTVLQTLELMACTQALVPFEVTIPLEVNGLDAGIYQVDVNDITDEFELSVDNSNELIIAPSLNIR